MALLRLRAQCPGADHPPLASMVAVDMGGHHRLPEGGMVTVPLLRIWRMVTAVLPQWLDYILISLMPSDVVLQAPSILCIGLLAGEQYWACDLRFNLFLALVLCLIYSCGHLNVLL